MNLSSYAYQSSWIGTCGTSGIAILRAALDRKKPEVLRCKGLVVRAAARFAASARERAMSFLTSLSLVSSLSMISCLPCSRSCFSASSSFRSSSALCSLSSRSASSCAFRYWAYCSSFRRFSSMMAAFSILYWAMRASVSGISIPLIRLNAVW